MFETPFYTTDDAVEELCEYLSQCNALSVYTNNQYYDGSYKTRLILNGKPIRKYYFDEMIKEVMDEIDKLIQAYEIALATDYNRLNILRRHTNQSSWVEVFTDEMEYTIALDYESCINDDDILIECYICDELISNHKQLLKLKENIKNNKTKEENKMKKDNIFTEFKEKGIKVNIENNTGMEFDIDVKINSKQKSTAPSKVYLHNSKTDGRYIVADTLRMYNYMENKNTTLSSAIKHRYRYADNLIVLKTTERLLNRIITLKLVHNTDLYEKETKILNEDRLIAILQDNVSETEKYVKREVEKIYEDTKYLDIDIHKIIKEYEQHMSEYISQIRAAIKNIGYNGYDDMYAKAHAIILRMINFAKYKKSPVYRQNHFCKEWIDVMQFRALYMTMDNLIKFHNKYFDTNSTKCVNGDTIVDIDDNLFLLNTIFEESIAEGHPALLRTAFTRMRETSGAKIELNNGYRL